MDVLAAGARTSRLGQTDVLAKILQTAADYVAAIRARDEIRSQTLAEGVETIRKALTRRMDELPADLACEVPAADDEMDILRQVAAIMNASLATGRPACDLIMIRGRQHAPDALPVPFRSPCPS